MAFSLLYELSQAYMTTGKTIALTRWTFVDKVMSLLFNMLSRLVTTFLPRSKRLFISWLQSPSALILELPPPPQIKSATVSNVSPSFCHEGMAAVADCDHGVLCFGSLRGASGLLRTFRGVSLKIRQARGTNGLLFYP